ncbi:Thioredoxin-like fold [Pseudocohnilembus persalinus]|uniref:Thioredoxin-like fold n=1 Tax=Pseudocohnilembus persalinus TaxID=266149 RepID=A0A0V0QHY6_PSEPJ|nr:Thioredoxin-like fold [Pseudocohnilembus persalinus]|eukprot:KRX01837.1 Thioredoxin-like fold [Pseudocohnilembus persalinus]
MQKILQKSQSAIQKLPIFGRYCYTEIKNSSVKQFDDIMELKNYLKKTRPTRHVVYAGASWNPMCEQASQDFAELSNKYPGYEFIQIDTDINVKAKKYFDVKCEPEYIIMNLGQEITRQTGQSKEALIQKFEKVEDQFSRYTFIPGTDTYENFEDQFMADYEEHDREFDWWAR